MEGEDREREGDIERDRFGRERDIGEGRERGCERVERGREKEMELEGREREDDFLHLMH